MDIGQQRDELSAKAADVVRNVISEAEERAAEIVREAEAEAERIRERADADARVQIEAAKRALDELGGTLVAAATEAIPAAETPAPEAEPEPDANPTPAPEPEPDPDVEPDEPPESPGAPEAPVSEADTDGSDATARLVAMRMAVEGVDRTEIEAALNERFGPVDRSLLLEEVLSRAAS